MIKGSCLCGNVRFAISKPPSRMNICHCSMCRKVTGTAYGVFAHIENSAFKWLAGESDTTSFESSPGHFRTFCKNCGSNTPNAGGEYVCIPAGCFDDDPKTTPELQIFADSKASWHELAQAPVSYAEFDPD